ncbi:MAG: hypothetical protein QNK03_01500 [Myxococcota bacterium]|nr:hypothetical protein [Myxococcota bacterium]
MRDRSVAVRWLVIGAAMLALACAGVQGGDEPAAAAAGAAEGPPKLLEGLGDHHHPITTSVPEAQRYFDQGLVLTFGFNHDAAVRSFREAQRLDPACAMCAWGEALALGPNINAPMGPEAARAAWKASKRARKLAEKASEAEQAYIAALAKRYAKEPPEDRAALDLAYANAMREVATRYPDDVDAATLFAEALMDLYPWDYWTKDGEPREYTEEIVEVLERVLQQRPTHVGANHYYIHATEEFFPERAEAAADRLGTLAPDAGHLVHMPSHIYWRVGRYDDALEINRRAAAADEQFFAWCRGGQFYRAAYYPHNVHFLWAAAAAEGRSEIALSTARKLAARVEEQVDDFPFVEEFLSIPPLTLVRFGRWDAVLGEPKPPAERAYLTGIHHYTRGIALVRTGDLDGAAAELTALEAVAAGEPAGALALAGGVATAAELLEIGAANLRGELAAARGDSDAAVAALHDAVDRQDALSYMEPPPWFFPVRQALGAVLLDAGRAVEAEAVFRKSLDNYPRNGWSLYGLARSLEVQGRPAEAAWVHEGFQRAFANADVELEAARF